VGVGIALAEQETVSTARIGANMNDSTLHVLVAIATSLREPRVPLGSAGATLGLRPAVVMHLMWATSTRPPYMKGPLPRALAVYVVRSNGRLGAISQDPLSTIV